MDNIWCNFTSLNAKLPNFHSWYVLKFACLVILLQRSNDSLKVFFTCQKGSLYIRGSLTSFVSESAVALLAHTAPPINTNFRITFLLTRLLEALYVYRASNLKSTITFLASVS